MDNNIKQDLKKQDAKYLALRANLRKRKDQKKQREAVLLNKSTKGLIDDK